MTGVEIDSAADRAADLAALAAQFIPVIGSIVSGVLSGQATQGRFDRVTEEMSKLAAELEAVRDQINEDYVRGDEFEELFVQTLEKMSRELDPAKRATYRHFIRNLSTEPKRPYHDQRKLLRLTDELTARHRVVIGAMLTKPPPTLEWTPGTGSALQTLTSRTKLPSSEIITIAGDLAREGLLNGQVNLQVMITGPAALDLRHLVSPFGVEWATFTAE